MKILIILGSGGHTAQMLKLVEMLGDKFDYAYMIGKGDALSEEKIRIKGEICHTRLARKYGENIFMTFLRVAMLSFESFSLILRIKPQAIISAGPGTAVPVSLIGKVLGKKVIFIEDWSRVYQKSGAGKIICKFADLFFIQWPELEKAYPKGIYAGRLA
ncbi:MAG: hypothetical protein LUP94_00640 [Candidatus Methanomethylicus sp.]|nr:hypothetical protein [Candidatus Methanomethylicus sp.]